MELNANRLFNLCYWPEEQNQRLRGVYHAKAETALFVASLLVNTWKGFWSSCHTSLHFVAHPFAVLFVDSLVRVHMARTFCNASGPDAMENVHEAVCVCLKLDPSSKGRIVKTYPL